MELSLSRLLPATSFVAPFCHTPERVPADADGPLPLSADDVAPLIPTDAELLGRLRAGDERALEVIFRAHYAGMCAFVQRFVYAPDVAEELVQDVFFKLWSKREQMTEIDALKTYLYRAARNTALNHLRRRKLEQSWEAQEAAQGEPVAGVGADQETSTDELALAVNGAVARLPGRCREVFLLSREGGLTYGQIAAALGISIKTVETQMGRALKSLRAALAKFRE